MTLPLHGERLIEASAGTGKTYTIAGLYLRLLLGHGSLGAAHPQRLTVDQILVVTFTEAATSELRDRIRRRIVEARNAFLSGFSDDPLIKPLLEQSANHQQCARYLLQALRQMDEAAIFTIHGFCQRMLKQHAFESGSYFETEFVTDETSIRVQVVEDFWREHFYGTAEPIDLALATLVNSYWACPESLLGEIANYLTNPFLQIKDSGEDFCLKERLSQAIASFDEIKAQWQGQCEQVLDSINGANIDKRSYSSKNLPKWFDEVCHWAQADSADLTICKNLDRFSQTMLTEKTKTGPAPSLPIFSAIDDFLTQSVSLKESIMAKAIDYVRAHIASHKQQASLLSFDDLLSGLANALGQAQQGSLAQKIRSQYPLAMIDEFQDTDLMQYQIFNTIYGLSPASDDEIAQQGLLMIGDPKQAIYGFRGADIFTYIKARRKVPNHYTLDTNYRSSTEMVAAVNALFAQSDAPFIYQQDIAFHPVKDANKKPYFAMDGVKQGAISQWLLPSDAPVNSASYQQSMALACATQINQLLTDAQQDKAQMITPTKGNEPEQRRGVVASDIAILVRTGTEANLVKRELALQGISSVYLSNRDSVFSAPVVSDVWRLLSSILEPTNARLLRSAMATPLLGLTATQLDQLNNDERLWQGCVERFEHFHQRWLDVGILAMLRELIHREHIPARLLSLPDGERQLTDLLHIGEVLQQQSLEIQGEHALVHWLAEKVNSTEQDNQEQQLRLESDKDLVQIVTIHKSKGLEYNLVFLPFICAFKQAKQAVYHQDDKTIVDLSVSKEALALADEERLAEDLRLLYVALTRGVHHCWLGYAPLKSGRATKDGKTDLHKSAIGYLLLGKEVTTYHQLSEKLAQLATDYPFIELISPPNERLMPYQALATSTETPQVCEFDSVIENDYWITSYSALSKTVHHSKTDNVDASTEQFDIDWEAGIDETVDSLAEETPSQDIFSFPRGAHAGTFLHLLFEEIDFVSAHGDELRNKVAELLEASEFDEVWLDVLVKLVADVLDSALDDDFSLRQLSMADKQVEMEFFMPISAISCDDINPVLAKHDALSKQAAALNFSQVQGMIKGFIDLVFVHQGKYYILDYKSNHLGDSPSDYDNHNISQMMIDHRYDFQYQLYTLALHRLLRSRIPDYDYEQHFGGVYYLFLRGMGHGDDPSHGIFSNRPTQAFIEQLDDLFAGVPA
ncbi:exodeoxyribonuclease V subunit beta [Alteromonadales bacterium alter-6D02]|nr:exodeoxyribonuclease V subunit beta [Alteromonadales bacterium alter-6D02]